MAILAVDEVMLREPRLLVPGLRPLGPVRLDRNYNCISFVLFGHSVDSLTSGNATGGQGVNRDIVNPSAIFTPTTYVAFSRESAVSTGTNNQYGTMSWVRGELAPPYTILCGWATWTGGVCWSLLAANAWTGVYASGNSFVVTNAADFAGSFPCEVGPKLPSASVDFSAISIAGSNNAIACCNGGPIVTDAAFTAPSFTPLGFRIGADWNGQNAAGASVSIVAVFKTAMSAGEIQTITRNPYAPLIPA